MAIRSKRREYFACHLTMQSRELLKAEAKRRDNMSMSKLGAIFIDAGLAAAGCLPIQPCDDESTEQDVPLPLED